MIMNDTVPRKQAGDHGGRGGWLWRQVFQLRTFSVAPDRDKAKLTIVRLTR
jgi:hypothetical protein